MTRRQTTVRRYDLHGIALDFTTNSPIIAEAVDDLLGHFARPDSDGVPDIRFSLRDPGPRARKLPAVPARVRPIQRASDAECRELRRAGVEGLALYLDERSSDYLLELGDRGLVRYNLDRSAAEGFFRESERCPKVLIANYPFFLVLGQLLYRRGLFSVHGAAVERRGRGVLLPGGSGAGKTTTAIALVRERFRFLGDDRVFLRAAARGGSELLAFPEHLDVTEKTISFFPELARHRDFVLDRNLRKKSFGLGTLYRGALGRTCRPRLILFPKVGTGSRCRLEPMDKARALADLIPHAMLVFDRPSAIAHFALLSDLVQRTDCFRLRLGPDLDRLPGLVSELL